MCYHTEFGSEYDVSEEIVQAVAAKGWIDTSWHNDACPSFSREDNHLRLWVDAVKPADRECGGPRYIFTRITEGAEYDDLVDLFETDDLKLALDYLSTL